jgi:hypothetical protein
MGSGLRCRSPAARASLADRIVAVARDTFYGGYQVAVFAAAAMLVITAVIAVVAGPRRSPD